jgi:hypothetical protein
MVYSFLEPQERAFVAEPVTSVGLTNCALLALMAAWLSVSLISIAAGPPDGYVIRADPVRAVDVSSVRTGAPEPCVAE